MSTNTHSRKSFTRKKGRYTSLALETQGVSRAYLALTAMTGRKKLIIISAVSFIEGGPLTILQDCLNNAAQHIPSNWQVVALVNSTRIECDSRVHLLPIPSAKKTWMFRLYWEWIGFYGLALRLKPHLWLSLHDITPRLPPCRQAVYCHNPAPFYRLSLHEALLSPSFLAFNILYASLYGMFIKRNDAIFVQQSWLRSEFIRRFGNLPIVVSHPSVFIQPLSSGDCPPRSSFTRFFYPAFPRVFKNFEILGEAVRILVGAGLSSFELCLTISGMENRYSRFIYKKYRSLPQIRFIGRQSAVEMRQLYSSSDAIVFPSKLETWGLPLSEAKAYNKCILAADLPYARETIGDYNLVSFFPVDCGELLANLMADVIQERWQPSGNHAGPIKQPFISSWESLWGYLVPVRAES
jgi:glycosyltransferase involved in cell wall biosynthesis